jgi:hypothetical protein
MDRNTIEPAIKIILGEIRVKLDEAAHIAKAAEACASTGAITEGVAVSMDIEQLVYEAGRLQDAASLLNRLSGEWKLDLRLPRPARSAGLESVAAHDAVVDPRGVPNDHPQSKVESREDRPKGTSQAGNATQTESFWSRNFCCGQDDRQKSSFRQIDARVLQAVSRAEDAS